MSKDLYVVYELRGWSDHGSPGLRSMSSYDPVTTYEVGKVPDDPEGSIVLAAGVTYEEGMKLIRKVPAKAYAWAVAGKIVETKQTELAFMKMDNATRLLGINDAFRTELLVLAVAINSRVLQTLLRMPS